MSKYAIIDIGSNSIRYGEEREGRIPDKEVFTTRLGAGLAQTGRLAEESVEKSMEVLKELGSRAKAAGLVPRAYATSAVRDAENGREFAARVERECGYPVEILSGEDEARFAYRGAVRGGGAMLDIGGASMQVVTEDMGVSFRAGCVRCGDIAREAVGVSDCDTEWRLQQEAVVRYMDEEIKLPPIVIGSLVGVGGTITTLAALKAGLTEFSRETVDSTRLSRGDVRDLIERLAEMGDNRRLHPLLKERHDVILYGAYILLHAMELLNVEDMGVSCSDGLEGYLSELKKREGESPEKPSLFKLFTAFNRIGAFTFGGGYAMLPMLERECVEKTGWVTHDELLDYFAIGQCTPGVIAVNTATFVGKKQRGIMGAFAATAGVVLPSFIIICVLTALLANFADIPVVKYALHGIRVAVGVLILNTVIKLVKEKIKEPLGYILAILAFLLVALPSTLGLPFRVSPVFVVIGAALIGVIRGRLRKEGDA
ncbi:MAG: chromate transporter [Clostridia bacterium]|nr:chromate transporter [Clostridia bacterium]